MRNNINSDAELVDIRTVMVERDLPKLERTVEYIRQIKNPFLYKCGKYTITAYHPDSGPTIEDCFQGLMT